MHEKQQKTPRAAALLAVAGCVIGGLAASAMAMPALAAPARQASPADSGLKVVGQPVGISFDRTTKTFWVAENNFGQPSDIVDRIAEIGHKITPTLVPSGVAGIVADSAKGVVWTIGNGSSGTTPTATFIKEGENEGTAETLPASTAMTGLAVDPSTGTTFALDEGGDVFTFDDAEPQDMPVKLITGSAGIAATGIAVDPATGTIWIVNAAGNSVLKFSESTGAPMGSPITVGNNPGTIGIDTTAKTVWVANSDATVSEFAEASPGTVHTLTLDSDVFAITADPQTSIVWLGTFNGAVTGFSEKSATPAEIGRLALGNEVDGLASDPASGQLWATEQKTSQGTFDNVIPFVPSAATITSAASAWFSVNNPSEATFPVRAGGFPPSQFSISGAPSFVKIAKLTGQLSGTLKSTAKLGAFKFTIKASNGIGKAASQAFTLNLGTTPTGVSTTATFAIGVKNTFQVKAKATPAATFQGLGLPAGLTLSKSGVLSGSLPKGTKSPVAFVVETSNLVTRRFAPVTSIFQLKLAPGKAAAITTKSSVTFRHGHKASFTIKSTGFPTPVLTKKGTLPKGLRFKAAKNGTATVSGTPAASDKGHTTKITITATNGVGKKATQILSIKIT